MPKTPDTSTSSPRWPRPTCFPESSAFWTVRPKPEILLGVGSSSKNAVSILERIGLIDRFATVMDGNRITLSKPDPQVFLFGAAALNTPPSECIVFEDAPAGIAAARAGGFTAVGIGPDGSLPTAHLTVPGFAGLSWQGLLDLIQ